MHYAWVILICCCLIQAGGSGAVASCLGLYVVPVCEEFGIGNAAFSLYLTIQNIFVAIAASFSLRMVLSVAPTCAKKSASSCAVI